MSSTRAQLAGIYPYLVSPVDGSTGAILEEPLRRLVEHLIEQGVQGVSPLGSTGEFAYLDRQQKGEIIRIVVDQVSGRVPVVPGVSAFSTVDALKQVEQAMRLGADAIVLMLQGFEVGDTIPPQKPLSADAVAEIRGAIELQSRLDAEL